MRVCMCVRMWMYVCDICVYVYVCAGVCMCACVCMCVCMCVCVCAGVFVCTSMCVCVCVFVVHCMLQLQEFKFSICTLKYMKARVVVKVLLGLLLKL